MPGANVFGGAPRAPCAGRHGQAIRACVKNAAAMIAARDPEVYARLRQLSQRARAVFFAGLPGTGKSLLVHQLVHLAHAARRPADLLQWDVVRPAIERSPAGAAYPVVDGVTHGIIRIAAGLWARRAVARWAAEMPGPEHILIGETPLVGHRFVELARPEADDAEAFLSGSGCRFVIPVPSAEVRRAIEAERARRIERPLHDREREDAPPHVLRAQWEALAAVAPVIGAPVGAPPAGKPPAAAPMPYDPDAYQQVYEFVLRRRHVQSLPVRTLLPAAAISVYDFAAPTRDLVPTPDEAAASVRLAEARFPDPRGVQAVLDRWYVV
jgi:hypothetical protein